MEHRDKDYPNMLHIRVIRYTLDDGTVLAAVVIGLLSDPQKVVMGFKVRATLHVLHTPKGSGPPGRDDYTDEELTAHRGDERFIMNEEDEWRGIRWANSIAAAMAKMRLERVWETDLFNKNGEPVYEPEFSRHA